MGCRGICVKESKRAEYINGFKSCKQCGRFFNTVAVHCPCCGLVLKTKPESSTRKLIYYKKLAELKLS